MQLPQTPAELRGRRIVSNPIRVKGLVIQKRDRGISVSWETPEMPKDSGLVFPIEASIDTSFGDAIVQVKVFVPFVVWDESQCFYRAVCPQNWQKAYVLISTDVLQSQGVE